MFSNICYIGGSGGMKIRDLLGFAAISLETTRSQVSPVMGLISCMMDIINGESFVELCKKQKPICMIVKVHIRQWTPKCNFLGEN